MVPAGRDNIPNGVLQPSILTQFRWTWWALTVPDLPLDPVTASAIAIWQYPREDLIAVGRLYQVIGRFTTKGRTEKEVIARE